MNCEQIIKLLDAYVDDELDIGTVVLIEDHVASCDQCNADLNRIRAVRSMEYAAVMSRCPPQVASRVLETIQLQSSGSTLPPRSIPDQALPMSVVRRQWPNFAVAAALLLSVVSLWQSGLFNRPRDSMAVNNLVAAHLRSLQADHLLDVVSTDQHTVKPWFNGKLDFSPHVKDFAAEGFPLEGGRLDYFDSHPVAALVYRHSKHVINVFVWPATTSRENQATSFEGFNLCTWTMDGLHYEAVSDLNGAELSQLAKLLQAP